MIRFYWLDGLRGLAALMVVFLHALDPFDMANAYLPNAALAVDFFFALSGFVLAFSYDTRLAGGMTCREFVHLRLIRLYPMIAVGTLLGVLVYCTKIILQHRSDLWLPMFGSSILNIVLLPSPWLVSEDHGSAWPIDLPLWSISFEFAINLAYALLLVRLTQINLVVVAISGALALLFLLVSTGGIGGGARWESLNAGLIRVVYPFSIGILMARLYGKQPRLSSFRTLTPLLCVVCFVATMLLKIPDGIGGGWQFFVVVVVFPLIIWVLALVENGRPNSVLEVLGELSYPLYALHYPVVKVSSFLMRHFGIDANNPWFSIYIVIQVLASIAMSALVLLFIDKPMRGFLNQRRRARIANLP